MQPGKLPVAFCFLVRGRITGRAHQKPGEKDEVFKGSDLFRGRFVKFVFFFRVSVGFIYVF